MFQRFRSKVFWTRPTRPATLVCTVFCTSLTVNADTTLSNTIHWCAYGLHHCDRWCQKEESEEGRMCAGVSRAPHQLDDAPAGWMQTMTLSKDWKFVFCDKDMRSPVTNYIYFLSTLKLSRLYWYVIVLIYYIKNNHHFGDLPTYRIIYRCGFILSRNSIGRPPILPNTTGRRAEGGGHRAEGRGRRVHQICIVILNLHKIKESD